MSLASKFLSGRHFSLAVDLGCGEGAYGEFLKQYCTYLIGVDHNPVRLTIALQYGGYDEGVLMDIRDYQLPENTEAVFMLDSIEHIPKQDGLQLLQKIKNFPFIIITTPLSFHGSLRNTHMSLWTVEDFQKLGYETQIFRRFYLFEQAIMAVKRS
jgi:trans-aconitate methyltransferase